MCGLAFIFVHLPYISALCIDYGCQTHAVHIRQNNKKRKRKEGKKNKKLICTVWAMSYQELILFLSFYFLQIKFKELR